jgi:hypothetical protein
LKVRTHASGTATSSHLHKHSKDDNQISANNNSEDRSFLLKGGFETLDNGHFRPKHVVKEFLSDFNLF